MGYKFDKNLELKATPQPEAVESADLDPKYEGEDIDAAFALQKDPWLAEQHRQAVKRWYDHKPPGEGEGEALSRRVRADGTKRIRSTVWEGRNEHDTLADCDAAERALNAIGPKDVLQTLVAEQMIAAHNAGMGCMVAIAEASTAPAMLKIFGNHAYKFGATFTRNAALLAKLQGQHDQKVVVQHLNIEPGGQAIVGSLGGDIEERLRHDAVPVGELYRIDSDQTDNPLKRPLRRNSVVPNPSGTRTRVTRDNRKKREQSSVREIEASEPLRDKVGPVALSRRPKKGALEPRRRQRLPVI